MAEGPGPTGDVDSDSHSDPEEYSGMEQPPLLKQLKTILAEYPDDGQIIKELVQNAEDAGAETMEILYDGRQLQPPLERTKHLQVFFTGPALCFHNNALFTEDDWRGIRMIYSSVKEEDPLKVGRFGLGFKSVFHITDYPWIVSGDRVLFMNPQRVSDMVCTSLPLEKVRRSRQMYVSNFIDCLKDVFGFDEAALDTGFYNGTLFRFPLRQTPSKLSDCLYDQNKIIDLFRSFQVEAPTVLLFLKSLSKVELFCKDCESEFTMDRSFFTVELAGDVDSLVKKRKAFSKKLAQTKTAKPKQHIVFDSTVCIKTTCFSNANGDPLQSRGNWMVVNMFMGGGMSKELQALTTDEDLCYSPYVGVAVPLDGQDNEFTGHVFCFLPLPQERRSLTGLPVHVNGFFALSQNRRHLKWPSADQDSLRLHTDKAIEWNQRILSEVLPKAYIILVQRLISSLKITQDSYHKRVYNCLPDVARVDTKWQVMVKEFYTSFAQKEFIFTSNKGGRWIEYKQALFTVFPDHKKLNTLTVESVKEAILLYNHDVADIPYLLWDALVKFSNKKNPPQGITAKGLSKILKTDNRYKAMSSEKKLCLLEFLLDRDEFDNVNGLELLPLNDGSFIAFNNAGNGQTDKHVFIHDKKSPEIFQGQESFFLLNDLPTEGLRSLFRKMQQSGLFQLRKITAVAAESLLSRSIEAHKQPDGSVFLNAGHVEWIRSVWEYILNHFQKELGMFARLKLMPELKSGSWESDCEIELHSLSGHTIMKEAREESSKVIRLPDGVCSILGAMRVVVLPTLPAWIPYRAVKSFIHYPSRGDVFTLLGNIESDNINRFNESARDEGDINAFLTFLSAAHLHDIGPEATEVLWQLQLFQEKRDLKERPTWISLSKNKRVYKPVDEFPIKFPESLVVVTDNSLRLANTLGAVNVGHNVLALTTMRTMNTGYYSADEIQRFMNYMLPKLGDLRDGDELLKLGKQIPFVKKEDGNFCRPLDLFDRSDDRLSAMFADEDVFPPSELVQDRYKLEGLRKLGLKRINNIKPLDLYNVAVRLDRMSSDRTCDANTTKKAQAFSVVLEYASGTLTQMIKQVTLYQLLSNLKWVPVSVERPKDYPEILPWGQMDLLLCSPVIVKSLDFKQTVGSVCPLIDCRHLGKLAASFEWDKQPSATAVYQQLEAVIERYDSSNKHVLLHMIYTLYKALSQKSSKEVKRRLKGEKRCIWTGDGFCSADEIYLFRSEHDIDLKPYMYPLPAECKDFNKFFAALGCLDCQNGSALLHVQSLMKAKYETEETFSEYVVDQDLSLTGSILRNMAKQENVSRFSDTDVLLPVHTGNDSRIVYLPAAECTYCDFGSLSDVEYDEEDPVRYVHSVVPNHIAKALGAKSLTESALKLSDAKEWGPEEWGQGEPLTTRIHAILQEYTDGLSVPKEILQNADDAGATEVCFLYDERENNDARTHLLTEEMSECQGPALWAYNNRTMTTSDMENIRKLNGATKENDEMKIGKFGLGFCSVFNVTDVPSFLSGNEAVIFDPHMTYLPDKSKGTKIDIEKMKKLKMMKRIKNQFKTFEGLFGCNLMANDQPVKFDGTLFRLPLRTAKQAAQSELSNKSYTKNEMQELLQMFMKTAGSCLLFLQHVKTIKLYHLPCSSSAAETKLIFRVEKTIHGSNVEAVLPALCAAASLKQKVQLSSKPLRRTELIDIEVLAYDSAYGNASNSNKSTWMTGWATGTDESLQMTKECEIRGALPLGSAAVLLQVDENGRILPKELESSPFGFYRKGHLFCFLPLPIETELKMHLNGCFAVTSDRKQLRVMTTDDKLLKESKWNDALLTDAICRAVVCVLEGLRDQQLSLSYNCQDFWPQGCGTKMKNFEKSFYRMLILSDNALFERNGRWVGLSRCVFLDAQLLENHEVGQIAFDTMTKLYKSSESVVMDTSDAVKKALTTESLKACKTLKCEKFFKTLFFPNFESDIWRDQKENRNKLTLFALVEPNKYEALFRKTRCIPVSNGVSCKLPSELVSPKSSAVHLFFLEDAAFPEKVFCKNKYLKILEGLGMQTERLAVTTLLDRARRIEELSKSCATCARLLCYEFLCYLSGIRDFPKHFKAQELETLKQIAFLPVLKQPTDWPFKWEATALETERSYSADKKCTNRLPNGDPVHTGKKMDYQPFVRPEHIFFGRRKNLTGCSGLLLDDFGGRIREESSGHVLTCLGVQGKEVRDIDITLVLKQLVEVTKEKYTSKTGSRSMRDEVCRSVYEAIDEMSNRQPSDMSRHLLPLHSEAVLVVGDRILRPKDVVFYLPYKCDPLVYGLNYSSITLYRHMLSAFGVRPALGIKEATNVLGMIRASSSDQRLQSNQIMLVFQVLLAFIDAAKDETMTDQDLEQYAKDNIPLPDQDGVLRSIASLCLDDKDIKTGTDMRLLHPVISNDVAARLGVKTKRRQRLQNSSSRIPFGQSEKLVNRLKRILTGYPCDSGIMKELLQNADDAGATEIEFIKDYTCHGTDKVIDEKCSSLQGPALCVYNNSSFSESDLTGIQSLGVGSKAEDPTKTGQYGVGFNAVYHLTDMPSFLSKGTDVENGETLCFLDPMCKFIPDATPEFPGLRLNQLDTFRQTDKDTFKGYHEDIYFKKSRGTVFRLPLRIEEMAKTSEISDEAISTAKLDRLLERFKVEMLEALLFVKNVTKISIVDITSGKRNVEYSVSVNISAENERKRSSFFKEFRTVSKEFLRNPHSVLHDVVKEELYEMEIKDTEGKSQKWLVVQRLGFHDPSAIDSSVEQAYDERKLGLLPHGGIALPLPRTERSEVHADGIPRSRGVSEIQHDKRAFCFLPLPVQTNLPVNVHGYFALDHEDRRNVFTDEGTFRHKWNLCLLEVVIAPAYVTALQFMKKQLFPESVETKTNWSKINERSKLYHSYFPIYKNAKDDIWKFLVKSVFSTALSKKADIFPVFKEEHNADGEKVKTMFKIEWIPLHAKDSKFPAYFNDLRKQIDKLHSKRDKKEYFREHISKQLKNEFPFEPPPETKLEWSLERSLRGVGMRLMSSPKDVYTSIKDSDVAVQMLSPEIVIDFLKSRESNQDGCCLLKELNIPVQRSAFQSPLAVQCLLHYCSASDSFLEKMNDLPLLVTGDHYLRAFSDTRPVILSVYSSLLPQSKDRFLLEEHIPAVDKRASVFQELSIDNFCMLLPHTLPAAQYRKTHPVKWDPKSKRVPNHDWITTLWTYLEEIMKPEKLFLSDKETRVRKIAAKLQELLEWCIIPSEVTGSHLLVCMERAFTVIEPSSFAINTSVAESIREMKVPKLAESFVHRLYDFKCLFATKENPLMLLKCLNFHTRIIEQQAICSKSCVSILEFFTSALPDLKGGPNTQTVKEMLKTLPFFTTIQETNISLVGVERVLVPPAGIPKDGIEQWARSTGTVLLIHTDNILPLYKFLGCATEDIADIYVSYIFPTFEKIPQVHQLQHIKYVKNNLVGMYDIMPVSDKRARLVEALRDLCFIHTEDGRVHKASHFFSPHENIFAVMCKKEQFPPDPFCSDEWKSFMELIGMQKDVKVATLQTFVTQLSNEAVGAVHSKGYVDKVHVVLEHMFQRANILNEGVLQRISKIQFIPPFKVPEHLTLIHQQGGDTNAAIAFCDAVPQNKAELVWTSCSMLPSWADPVGHVEETVVKEWVRLLQIASPPEFEKVVTNVETVCNALHELFSKRADMTRPTLAQVENLVSKFYDFLFDHKDQIPTVKEQLFSTPLLYFSDSHAMVPAKEVVLNLSTEIRPYLYKFPLIYGRYFPVFEQLGCAEKVSFRILVSVLERIFENSKGNELHAEELRLVSNAVRCLIELLKSDADADSQSVPKLYLPNEAKVMTDSKCLVVVDNNHYRERMKDDDRVTYFLGFGPLKIHVSDVTKTIATLPDQLRPALLSEIVTVELCRDRLVKRCGQNSKRLEGFFQSPELLQGLMRLICNETNTTEDANLCDEISTNLGHVECIEVECLQTMLHFKGTVIPDTEERKESFVDTVQDNSTIWRLYFQGEKSFDDLLKALMKDIVSILEECAGRRITQHKYYVSLAQCISCPETIEDILDRERIKAYNIADRYYDVPVFPEPGASVPERFHPLLQQGFSLFEDGEYIAFEVDDPVVRENFSLEDEENMPVYIYARVLKAKDTNINQALSLRKYEIDVGQGKQEIVESYRLYKFTREERQRLETVLYVRSENSGEQRDGAEDDDFQESPEHAEECKELPPLKETLKSIRIEMQSAWPLPKEERKKVMRRLFLEWHPDKNNKENEGYCTKAFQYLRNVIHRLEQGETIPDNDEDREENASESTSARSGASSHSNFHDYFRGFEDSEYYDFFEELFRRGRSYGGGGRRRSGRSRASHSERFDAERPQRPQEGQRWLRQARSDMAYARTLLTELDDEETFNWICYICHQAAEKALKALWFTRDVDKVRRDSHDLESLAAGLGSNLMMIAGQLTRLLGDDNKMRYPDARESPRIPADVYTGQVAKRACDLAEKLVQIVADAFP